MGSLPIIIFGVFLAALTVLGLFLDAMAKMAARAEQERRLRAREAQAKTHGSPPQAVVARPAAPPPPARREQPAEEDLLRQLLNLGEPAPQQQRPAPRRPAPAPVQQQRPRQVPVARPVAAPAARLAPRAPGEEGAPSLIQHRLSSGVGAHRTVFGGADAAAPVAQGLAALDRLTPLARAIVLTEVFGKPMAMRPRQLHRTRPV